LQLFVVRFVPEPQYFESITLAVVKFLTEVDETVEKLMEL
jgi:hypothetical protein